MNQKEKRPRFEAVGVTRALRETAHILSAWAKS